MSAGAMVAGGLAFYDTGYLDSESGGGGQHRSADGNCPGRCFFLGLIFTALIRKYFVETKDLPYAMGQVHGRNLAGGGRRRKESRNSLCIYGRTAVFTVIRDWFGKIPATLMSQKMLSYGSAGGIWLSPMLVSIGYIIGPVAIGVWFLGALIGDLGILIGGQTFGIWDAAQAASVKQSLGIGLMVGTGVGILLKEFCRKRRKYSAECSAGIVPEIPSFL